MVTFEWDSEKARANLVKHGIGFEEAQLAFADPFLIGMEDQWRDGELRQHILGSVKGLVILFVAHTVKQAHGQDVIRLISARRATRGERANYSAQFL